jgi:hypothetical protein
MAQLPTISEQQKTLENQRLLKFQGFLYHRGDKIRTCGLRVPNAALYQTEPRLDLTPNFSEQDS